ncbi:conserved uncharacterized protein [Desulfococcus multivorans]|nr:conserved uncharacterized protein [Desulfococcus multivorans]
MSKAGLLVFGSSYYSHLPICVSQTVVFANFVPDYSGGTTPDFHGIPILSTAAP